MSKTTLSLTAGLLAVTAALAAPAAQAADAQIVVRDAGTGQLRAATAEEAATLRSASTASRAAAAAAVPLPRVHSSGARGARLTNDFLSYSVLVRQPDGTLVEQCFPSKEAAEAAALNPVVKATRTQPETE